MKKLILAFLSPFLFSTLFSFQASYDINLTPQCGAENLSTVHYNIEWADKYLLESIKYNPENNWRTSIIHGTERFLELSFIWTPLNTYLNVIQHEFFGHGYRIRDLGKDIAVVKKYKIRKPYPFGEGGGYTSFEYKKMTPFYESAIAIGGTEATSIFARELKINWLKDRKINPLQSSLYLEAFHDLTIYTLITHNNDILSDRGNDVAGYIRSLSIAYFDAPLDLDKLKRRALINLLDPFTYFSAYSYFKYIVCGKSTTIPMFKIKNCHYLPALRLAFSPFGPETYFENFLSTPKGPIYFYIKRGHYWENNYFGLGLEAPSLFQKNNFTCGLKADLWHQPLILHAHKALRNIEGIYFYDFEDGDLMEKTLGCSLTLITNYRIKKLPLFLEAAFGYKTEGFVPGESLSQSPIVRIGLAGSF